MINKLLIAIIAFSLCLLVAVPSHADAAEQGIVWFDGNHPVAVYMPRKVSPVVKVSADMFSEDMNEVTGHRAQFVRSQEAVIRIVQLNQEPAMIGKLRAMGFQVDSLKRHKESFSIRVSANRQIWVVGADARGTAYGILEMSRLAGVSPWIWWGDVHPERKSCLALPTGYETFQHPSVEYRGIFLNDEDWSLQPWSWRNYSPASPGYISAATYRQVFRLLLRLRANMIWPGMHGMTVPFYEVKGAKEAADSCGIVIGTSHCEPLMRNNVGEWKVSERGNFNYLTNKAQVVDYWTERLKEVSGFHNIYTIGMRGVHDGQMEGVKGLDEQTQALQRVINDQRELLRKYVNADVEKVPQQFVPYKEVLQIMENGLKVPDDVTLTWCDDNYGYMTRLSDSLQQKRSGGSGIYYHLSYWGRPHDYMWLCSTQPGLVYNEMRQAYDHQARKLWVVNVHDLKTASYDLELFLDLAWNINSVSPSTIRRHMETCLRRDFGEKAGSLLVDVMQEYYRLCAIRKPEFMGWSQVEVSKDKYARGWTPVKDTEFSQNEFGDELNRYLEDWQEVVKKMKSAEAFVPRDRRDAFFAAVRYPVECAANMSMKVLEGQKARAIAKADYGQARWQRSDSLYAACARSMEAYQRIRLLTAYWNDSLAGGKWRYSMCDHPRDLYVFYPASLPIGLNGQEVARYVRLHVPHARPLELSVGDSCVVRNASQYSLAGSGAQPVQMLGHSMSAVSLPKGKSLTYDFETKVSGQAVLRTAVIPTQPNDKGDIRFSVSIDGAPPVVLSYKEGFRTESWKVNVLRGQAIRNCEVYLKAGKHTLTITALDNHVVIDQWMIDYCVNRQFYVFPVTPSYR